MEKDHILKFEQENFGMLRDGKVILANHNEAWKKLFLKESQRLDVHLGVGKFKFHHIGSTSIPGIVAKPIIDMIITAAEIKTFDQFQNVFENLGYEYKGEYGISGRRYCVLYNEEKTKSYVHIHGFEEDHPEVERHLIFCDYLRAHPEEARKYEKLKLSLVSDLDIARKDYSSSKAELIQQILKDAFNWKQN